MEKQEMEMKWKRELMETEMEDGKVVLEEHLFWIETNSQPWLKHIETELCHQLRPLKLIY